MIEWNKFSCDNHPDYNDLYLCFVIVAKEGGYARKEIRSLLWDSLHCQWRCENMIVCWWARMPSVPEVKL